MSHLTRLQHYLTGDAKIDADHVELVKQLDVFDHEDSSDALEHLIALFSAHFLHEEQLMAESNYLPAESHARAHRMILDGIRQYHESSPQLIMQYVRTQLGNYLMTHIDGYDMHLAEYLRQHGKSSN